MRIGIDLDGVCYQWDKTARYMLREILPQSPYTKDGPLGAESTSWDYIQENVSKRHWKWLWNEGMALGLFRHGHLFPGTIKALRELSQWGRLVALTHRPDKAIEDTFAWINFHRLPFSEVVVTSGPKARATAPTDVFIDDKLANCEEIAAEWPQCTVALMDRPWNQGQQADGIARICSWDDYIRLTIERHS